MGKNLAWILLAVSMALNIFFAGGAIYSKVMSERLRASPVERPPAPVPAGVRRWSRTC